MSSGFITEAEIAEAKQKRQEEWEKVRSADDPLEPPEQPFDSRSLYERLQEQKQKKELEYEEAHKLKNMIKGLDDDEIEFLDLVDRTKLAADRRKTLEEEKELSDYRSRVATLQEKSLDQKLQAEIAVNKPKTYGSNRSSQTKLLKGVIVTKSEPKKRKASDETEGMEHVNSEKTRKLDSTNGVEVKPVADEVQVQDDQSKNKLEGDGKQEGCGVDSSKDADKNSGLTCIGILPGLGYYEESSSDDDVSSNSDRDGSLNDDCRFDLMGRKMGKKSKLTRKEVAAVETALKKCSFVRRWRRQQKF